MLQLLGMVPPILLHFALETGTLLLCRFLVVLGVMRNMTWDFLHYEKLVQLLGCEKLRNQNLPDSAHLSMMPRLLQLWHVAL